MQFAQSHEGCEFVIPLLIEGSAGLSAAQQESLLNRVSNSIEYHRVVLPPWKCGIDGEGLRTGNRSPDNVSG
jgi:hypothetical protein